MSRSTLMILLEIVVPVVSSGIASANANARLAIRRDQRAKALHHTTVDFDGDETLAVVVEVGDRPGFVFDRALERDRGVRRKAEREVPKRVHHETLEREPAGD